MTAYLWPLPKDVRRVITSPYGYRTHPVYKTAKQFHNGIDLHCPVGTPVLSPADGVVEKAWVDLQHGGGLSLRIKADQGPTFGFAHLSDVSVRPGQKVKRGEKVALTGGAKGHPMSGASTGPHLHFTLRIGGETIDPTSANFED